MLAYLTFVITTESPKFYLMKDTPEGDAMAGKVLRKIYQIKTDAEEKEVIAIFKDRIEKKTSKITLSEAFCNNPQYKRASWVNIGHIILHELTGINVITGYANIILANISGGSGLSPRMGSIIITLMGVLGGIGIIPVLAKWGRKPILIVGYAAIFACHMAIGTFTILEDSNPVYGFEILTFLCLFIVSYQLSTG